MWYNKANKERSSLCNTKKWKKQSFFSLFLLRTQLRPWKAGTNFADIGKINWMLYIGVEKFMPKFLDTPSWYGDDGDLLFASGYKEIDCSASGTINIYLMDLPEGRYKLTDSSLSSTNKTVIFWFGTSDMPGTVSIKNSSVNFKAKRVLSFFSFELDKKSEPTDDPINRTVLFKNFRLGGTSNTGSILPTGEYTWLVFCNGGEENSSFTISLSSSYGVSVLCYSNTFTAINGYYNNHYEMSSIYAPTSAGIDGYILTSNGSGAPQWEDKFTFQQETIPTSVYDSITIVSDTVASISTIWSYHTIVCQYNSYKIYFPPLRSTSAAAITDFSDVVSLVYSNGHEVACTGQYNKHLVYGAMSTGTSFYLLTVA